MIDRRSLIATASAAALTGIGAAPAHAFGKPDIALPPAPLPGLKIAPELYPTLVRVKRSFEPGSIHVISSQHYLYYIVKPRFAIRYGVAVGKAELVYRGEAVVGRKVEWPSWKPTPEMIERDPAAYEKYADGMPGGPENPLGARALYLYHDGIDTAIRIHGTTQPNSIGRSVSNGCLRMVNDHVIDLYNRVSLGTPVTVY